MRVRGLIVIDMGVKIRPNPDVIIVRYIEVSGIERYALHNRYTTFDDMRRLKNNPQTVAMWYVRYDSKK